MRSDIVLKTEGAGIVCYSPFAVESLTAGEDFLTKAFTQPEDVTRSVKECRLTGFRLAAAAEVQLVVFDDKADVDYARDCGTADFGIRLGLEVKAGGVCFRDWQDLAHWNATCPPSQQVALAAGFYRISAMTSRTAAGQRPRIYLYFEKWPERPRFPVRGIPGLGVAD